MASDTASRISTSSMSLSRSSAAAAGVEDGLSLLDVLLLLLSCCCCSIVLLRDSDIRRRFAKRTHSVSKAGTFSDSFAFSFSTTSISCCNSLLRSTCVISSSSARRFASSIIRLRSCSSIGICIRELGVTFCTCRGSSTLELY